jgi:hypothetical protein
MKKGTKVMKLLKNILFSLVMLIAVAAYGASKEVQLDLLMSKITVLLKADKATDALPYFAQLEGLESSLSKPLPESFHFYYIETLDKAGNKTKALERANVYLEKFGKKNKYYGQVIEIMSRLQIEADKVAAEQKARDDRAAAEQKARDDRAAAEQKARYEKAAKAEAEQRTWEDKFGFKSYDDTFMDTQTGLTWLRNGELFGKVTFLEAATKAKTVNIGGYYDWRLPTREEIKGLINRIPYPDSSKLTPAGWFIKHNLLRLDDPGNNNHVWASGSTGNWVVNLLYYSNEGGYNHDKLDGTPGYVQPQRAYVWLVRSGNKL